MDPRVSAVEHLTSVVTLVMEGVVERENTERRLKGSIDTLGTSL